MAALRHALRIVDKRPEDIKIIITGVGAAGTATTNMLLHAGFGYVIGCDGQGALYRGRPGNDELLEAYAAKTNPEQLTGRADELLTGADVYIGLSAPGAVSRSEIKRMAKDAIVFALANPTPKIAAEQITDLAAVIASGRSDDPNQINNVLAFPGIFRGRSTATPAPLARK